MVNVDKEWTRGEGEEGAEKGEMIYIVCKHIGRQIHKAGRSHVGRKDMAREGRRVKAGWWEGRQAGRQ